MSSDNHCKSFTPELVQSFTAKVMVVCRQTITAKVSHQNWCKVSQQKSCLYVVRQSPQKFHTRTGAKYRSKSHIVVHVVRQSPQKFHTTTGAKFHSKNHGHMSSDNHRKSFTPELMQSIAAKVIVVHVVRQSPQKFHTRKGAKFHSKSHVSMSDNQRKSFTPELVQSFTAKVMVVCSQTITAKVSHQNWCKVSQQKSCLFVVRQSLQKFHTRTGAKFHSKSHVCLSSDNHCKSFTPELVQSIAARVMVVRRETITVVVSYGRLSFKANAGNNIFSDKVRYRRRQGIC